MGGRGEADPDLCTRGKLILAPAQDDPDPCTGKGYDPDPYIGRLTPDPCIEEKERSGGVPTLTPVRKGVDPDPCT